MHTHLKKRMPPNRYRRSVGIMLINDDKKVFVGQRRDYSDVWQMPQGGVDKNEPLINAAFRELYEETGIKTAKLIYKSRKWHKYDLPAHLLGKIWRGRYRGQKQKWFLMAFTGNEKQDIDLKAYSYQEFQSWQWVELNELLALDVAFKQETYKAIAEEFSPIIENL